MNHPEPKPFKNILTYLKNFKPTRHDFGLCWHIELYCSDAGYSKYFPLKVIDLMRGWPKSKGSFFPIEGCQALFHKNCNKYNPETKYGALRLELLAYLITQLKLHIKTLEQL